MLLSYNWLKQYLNLPSAVTVFDVGEKLKISTVEVEAIKKMGENLENIVVGKVMSADKHPDADKLKLCKVDIGHEQVKIVCGGSNVVEGMLVALAKIGAKVRWHGEGDLIELAATKIRGIESSGMICASAEIGLGDMFPIKDEKEILDLTNYNFKVGEPLTKALGLDDIVLEIDNKSLSNRPDLWGHYGIAREVAVLFNKDLADYKTEEIKTGKELKVTVEVLDKKLCPRYMAVAVGGIKVGPSPDWLKKKLLTVGINPINNIVDITNYVMLDIGQPMHAFDAELVGNDTNTKIITIRLAEDKEKFKALDDNEYELTENDLVIADSEKVLAVAGVIGGVSSAITNNTKAIIFESANFLATNIRKTSTRLDVRTDSAQRFEKSLDPNLCELALKKAVELVCQICPEAKAISKVVDESDFVLPVGPIEIAKNLFEKKIGAVIPEKEIVRILEKLGFELKDKKDAWSVKIPTWRATKDISLAEDLVEEVLRIYGYDKIVSSLPNFPINPPVVNKLRKLEHQVVDILVQKFSYNEVYNYSFISGEQIKNLADDPAFYIELDNPLAKDRPYLRRQLLPNLLANVAGNISHRSEVKIFEIGKVFRNNKSGLRTAENSDELLPNQDVWFTAVYVSKKEQNPFWEVRRLLEALGQELKFDWETVLEEKVPVREHATRTALIRSNIPVGVVGEVAPKISENFGVDYRVGFLQLNLSDLQESGKFKEINYVPASNYPEVERDVAIVVNKKFTHQEIVNELQKIDPLLIKVELFDVYTGEHVAIDKKSMAYRLTYYHPDHTLVSVEVDTIHNKVLSLLQKKFSAEIR
ncbi:MAG: Phenylalanine-tRNA ligase beta subunit [Candidatus Magasanikbacteria bacterium GW2011_GWA2_37_8]|uniref:Phenylalanine--tRNA ligase beta subunit n=1 Tax=Candidatus Magasanikbacteria bacterium GW2011_GWA2_37_8 TaxID=1619036 RepID=A0A0G0HQB0_9BACT|nr:MAG: Phenylalanine-tRNA ligase beta subunit [Candidatus Magasanikbacteria bacterium GW2011_GWA2_37_8]